jgi:hypothetical protein
MSYSGDCNSCGKCCTGTTWNPHEQKLVTVYCENLILGETPGRPQATMCAAHKTKTLGMKVIFYTGDGVGSYEGQCLSNWICAIIGKPYKRDLLNGKYYKHRPHRMGRS